MKRARRPSRILGLQIELKDKEQNISINFKY